MTLPAVPVVPQPTSTTFATDALAFTQFMADLGTALPDEIDRLNALGFGSYNATSATSLTVGTGSKTLTVETGKGYVAGQAVLIAQTSTPTNYMAGQVTSYNSGTGALVVNATASSGSGTAAAWSVSVTALVAGGGVSPDSIVVLTSGTSWTCPAGVTKARVRLAGPGGSYSSGSSYGAGGGGGGVWECIVSVTPGVAYTYSIGASAGASTTMTIGGATHTAYSGGSASYVTPGFGGTATGSFGVSIQGSNGGTSQYNGGLGLGGCSAIGYGRGSNGSAGGGGLAETSGAIILELYK